MVVFLIELAFLSRISTFSENLNHQWMCREQKENFQTILVIIFWNFKSFYRSDMPQVKQNLIPSITILNLVYQLSHESINDLRLRILGN